MLESQIAELKKGDKVILITYSVFGNTTSYAYCEVVKNLKTKLVLSYDAKRAQGIVREQREVKKEKDYYDNILMDNEEGRLEIEKRKRRRLKQSLYNKMRSETWFNINNAEHLEMVKEIYDELKKKLDASA